MTAPIIEPEKLEGDKLRLHIDSAKGRVIVDFGVNLSHLEIPPHEAEIFAHLLLKHAHIAKMAQ